MSEPLEESYFNWLCAKVLAANSRIYRDLLNTLHKTEFVWVIIGDKNRAEDGLELREDFLREARLHRDPNWSITGCSVLEMLVAFSRRASFQTDIPDRDWFWKFIENLELSEYRHISRQDMPLISDILYAFVNRTYSDNGWGGLFPLRWPKEDQRNVEIWYQFFEYLEEQHLM